MFEDLVRGVVHPQGVEPHDRFAMARLLLGARGNGSLLLFVDQYVQPVRNPLELVEQADQADVVFCLAPWARSATARFPFATRGQQPPLITPSLVLVRSGVPVLGALCDEVLGAVATVQDRTLAAVIESVTIGMASEGKLRLQSVHGRVQSWAGYCRAESGDDQATGALVMTTRDLEDHIDVRVRP